MSERDQLLAELKAMLRPDYLSREQLAEELSVDVKTIRRMEDKDGLPIRHLGGSVFRFYRPEVNAWILARKKRGEAA